MGASAMPELLAIRKCSSSDFGFSDTSFGIRVNGLVIHLTDRQTCKPVFLE